MFNKRGGVSMSNNLLTEQIVNGIKKVLSHRTQFTALHEPSFHGNERKYVLDCIDTGWVSSAGKYVDQFERELASYTGSSYAIAVVNGTAAVHISLLLAGVKPGDEVLIPALTFVATANAVMYSGAIPHFVEVEEKTFGIDAERLNQHLEDIGEIRSDGFYNKRSDRRIAAIVPMHVFGHPVQLGELIEVASRYQLPIVEDAAESLGSYYKGKHTGTFGICAAVSFNGNKVITTGGGGAILTSDEGLARKAKHLTTTAKLPHRWSFQHDEVGYNYRLPNINAALGCAQIEQLPSFIENKRMLANQYIKKLSSIEGLTVLQEPADAKSNYWLNAIVLDSPNMELRDLILEKTNAAGFMTRPLWTPMHQLIMYSECPRMDLTVTERLAASVINIPSSPFLWVEQ